MVRLTSLNGELRFNWPKRQFATNGIWWIRIESNYFLRMYFSTAFHNATYPYLVGDERIELTRASKAPVLQTGVSTLTR